MSSHLPRPRPPLPPALHLPRQQQQQEQQGVPGRQLMEDRWPGGEETPFLPNDGSSGSPTLAAWPNQDGRNGMMDADLGRGQLGMGIAPHLGEQSPPDPFAMERPPVLNANGGGGGAAAAAAARGGSQIGAGEIRAKPPARCMRRVQQKQQLGGVVGRLHRRGWNGRTADCHWRPVFGRP